MSATITVPAPAKQPVRIGWLLSTAVVWIVAVGFAAFCWFGVHGGVHGLDARAYWAAARSAHPYGAAPGTPGAYLYPPPFTLLVWPLARLPLHLFVEVWMLAEAAAFAWLLKPLGWRWGVPAFLGCFAELIVGNIHAFLAVAAVLGLRHGAAWAVPLLTKVTSGIGVLWFAVTRDWGRMVVAAAITGAVAALSAVVLPQQWAEWWHFTVSHAGAGQLLFPLRLAAAAAAAVIGARLRRPWLLAPALILAQPVAEWMSLTLLAAVPRLRRRAGGVL